MRKRCNLERQKVIAIDYKKTSLPIKGIICDVATFFSNHDLARVLLFVVCIFALKALKKYALLL